MKIKQLAMDYDAVMALPRAAHKDPKKPSLLLSTVVRLAAIPDLRQTHFTYTTEGMEKVGDQPALILMNHSSFIDLMIMYRIFYPTRFAIVCTGDGFVGKEWLMRRLGCVPTRKFVTDITLVRDMEKLLKEQKTSVLMYPEASYSFDGTATALPRKMGVLLKKLGVPVVMVRTYGAFSRDPLYNNLQKRQVDVRAEVKCLVSASELQEKSVRELDRILDEAFTFDHFRWQQENHIRIPEPFRADGLNRILYKCAACGAEGSTRGEGTALVCRACGKKWELTEDGFLESENGVFDHIPDWYAWERSQVREELEKGTYSLETDVEIGIMLDYKAIYMVGSGHLSHSTEGFHLTGCGGRLDYTQSPLACYGLYSDYYWYEIGDVICIGNGDVLYYCFPKGGDVVAKTRMAAEELYKLKKHRRQAEVCAPGSEPAKTGASQQ